MAPEATDEVENPEMVPKAPAKVEMTPDPAQKLKAAAEPKMAPEAKMAANEAKMAPGHWSCRDSS